MIAFHGKPEFKAALVAVLIVICMTLLLSTLDADQMRGVAFALTCICVGIGAAEFVEAVEERWKR
jgi:hypothetical protein